jgi:hypothetical protein
MDDLLGEEAERFVVRVRCQRAWAWAHMDEIPAAGREADSLLQVALVQQTFGRLVYVLLLAGFLALHQGNSRSAIAHTARAWDVFTNDLPPQPRPAGLRYLVDCLLDLRAWDLVREHGPSMVLPDLPGDTAALLASTRAEALRAQADGAHERARDLMLAQVDGARSYIAAIQVARYLHHLAMIRLDLSSPEEARKAVVEFREALDRFGPVGYGYFRARSLIGLAHAESLCGDRQAAYCSVDEAIAMSRKIGSRGSLASALEVRAELRVF